MSESYIGEIRVFAGNFAPSGWAFCDGQLLAIAENDALYSLIGTTYGGDGVSTFGLPDLRSRIPIGSSTSYTEGMQGGAEAVFGSTNLPTSFSLGRGLGYGVSGTRSVVATTAGQYQPECHALTCNYIISLYGIYPSPA